MRGAAIIVPSRLRAKRIAVFHAVARLILQWWHPAVQRSAANMSRIESSACSLSVIASLFLVNEAFSPLLLRPSISKSPVHRILGPGNKEAAHAFLAEIAFIPSDSDGADRYPQGPAEQSGRSTRQNLPGLRLGPGGRRSVHAKLRSRRR